MQAIVRGVFLIVFVFFLTNLNAQQVLNGTISDKVSGEPIPGATILIKGSSIGTSSDFDGLFSLPNINLGDQLEVSYVGFKTIVIIVEKFDGLEIELEESLETLNEVVVTGYGSQRKRDITGAVSLVNSKQIDEIKPIKIEQALQGTVAGVNISTQSGAPGAGLNIRIRGISTNGDASPVAIIDGYQGDLGTLNPADIESKQF